MSRGCRECSSANRKDSARRLIFRVQDTGGQPVFAQLIERLMTPAGAPRALSAPAPPVERERARGRRAHHLGAGLGEAHGPFQGHGNITAFGMPNQRARERRPFHQKLRGFCSVWKAQMAQLAGGGRFQKFEWPLRALQESDV